MDILYAGGSRHGQIWEPGPRPPITDVHDVASGIDPGAIPANRIGDPAGVDWSKPAAVLNVLATGEAYRLIELAFQVLPDPAQPPSPVNVPVIYQVKTYLYAEIGDQQQALMAFQDAVLRQWFMHHAAVGPDPTSNGHTDQPVTVYWAECKAAVTYTAGGVAPGQCKKPIAFATMLERAGWLRQHIDATGHAPAWFNATPTEGSNDGGTRIGDVQEG